MWSALYFTVHVYMMCKDAWCNDRVLYLQRPWTAVDWWTTAKTTCCICSVLELRSAGGRQLRPRVVPLPNEMFDLFKRNEPKVATSAQPATHDRVTVPKAAAAKSDYQFESGSDDDFRNVPPITRKTRRPLTERRKKANDLDGFIVSACVLVVL